MVVVVVVAGGEFRVEAALEAAGERRGGRNPPALVRSEEVIIMLSCYHVIMGKGLEGSFEASQGSLMIEWMDILMFIL